MFFPLKIQTFVVGVAKSLAASQVILMPASQEHSPYSIVWLSPSVTRLNGKSLSQNIAPFEAMPPLLFGSPVPAAEHVIILYVFCGNGRLSSASGPVPR